MTITVFASGSSGNCALVSEGDTHLLIDAGISLRRITAGLAGCGVAPEKLAGVLITHEHNDHVSGLPMLCKHHATPVFAPRTVANALRRTMTGVEEHLRELVPDEPTDIGSVSVTAFPTPHDTDQSVGYRIEGSSALGFCTDCGCVTDAMRRGLAGCRIAVIEANHDLERLRYGPYPVYLKRRILSERGHLSNDDCAALAAELASGGTETLILGHLSKENNRPALARECVRRALDAAGFAGVRLELAPAQGLLRVEDTACCV